MKSSKSKKGKIKAKAGAQQFQKLIKPLKPSFVEMIDNDINHLFPQAKPLIRKTKKGKDIPDKRLFDATYLVNIESEELEDDELEHTVPSDVRGIPKYIAEYVIDSVKVPKNSKILIKIYTAMRCAKTNIECPSKDTVNRIIYNLNQLDVYRLRLPSLDTNESEENINTENTNIDDGVDTKDTKEDKQDDDGGADTKEDTKDDGKNIFDDFFNKMTNASTEERDIPIGVNESIILGPVSQCNFDIILNGGKEIYIPDKIISPIKIKGMSGRTIYKPRTYKRTTIIVDIIGSEGMVQKITRETLRTMNENKETVNQIAESIKKGNSKDIDNLVGSLNNNNGKKKRKRNRKRKRKININNNTDENSKDNEKEELKQQMKSIRE